MGDHVEEAAKVTTSGNPTAGKPPSALVAAAPRVPDTVAIIGIAAGANLGVGYNFLFGRNAGRNIRNGRFNIIIGDDELGKDEDMQVILSPQLPEICDFQLANAVAVISMARERIIAHCSQRFGEETIRRVFARLDELQEYCIVRIRMLEQPVILAADKAYLQARYPRADA